MIHLYLTNYMNNKLEEMFQDALAHIEAMTIEEFEQDLCAVNLNPVRLSKTYKYNTILSKNYSISYDIKREFIKKNLDTSYFKDNFFYETA